ncbi:Uncharacterized conserved protein YabE, contains G5 and tandem DUF348 domains [Clostridium cavendishii DSM 21758]|uniref:Uncharacterized conserved protein YabE, contains G5 and tandem DUF348 domains n=1 Tax=Clostridium cavendishii DSM 21758 TaxID=1121302 RepID=A0A1M6PDX2_9CLOT|nr:ubiquitin-like domain-containing protein [Clostridium cavendishii]SHK06111.1 Uncharacterized conserved protein YabE, contains G5 and tandem DUF348 domains [Clostridium cavendishii DSM 21758]
MVKKFRTYLTEKIPTSPKAKVVACLVVSIGLMVTIASMKKTLIVNIDGKEKEIVTYKGTVEGALQDNKIILDSKDKVTPELNSKIGKNDKITIIRAKSIVALVDSKKLSIKTAEANVKDMLKAEGIKLNEEDRVEPAVNTKITEGLQVEVTRVETKLVSEKQQIDFDTVVNPDENLDKSVTKLIQEGELGEKEVTYKVVYENGQEKNKKVVGEKVLKDPKNKVLVKGTISTLVLSRGGDMLKYKKQMSMVATAYAGDGITATGVVPRRVLNGMSTIAVDPSVIPLGTKVYVQGYGYAIAQDTGGLIKNRKIDLFMNSESEANTWGVRSVNVYIVAYPGEC